MKGSRCAQRLLHGDIVIISVMVIASIRAEYNTNAVDRIPSLRKREPRVDENAAPEIVPALHVCASSNLSTALSVYGSKSIRSVVSKTIRD